MDEEDPKSADAHHFIDKPLSPETRSSKVSKHETSAPPTTSIPTKALHSHNSPSPESVPNTNPRDRYPASIVQSKIGFKTTPTRAEGGAWDDEFVEVDEMAFDPSSFRNNDEQDGDSDDNEGREEEAKTFLPMRSVMRDVAGDEEREGGGEGAMESIEYEEEGHDDAAEVDESERMVGDDMSFDGRRMVRSMNPSPQPPPSDG